MMQNLIVVPARLANHTTIFMTSINIGVADYGMSVWEGGCFDLEARLHELREAGFCGVEKLAANDAPDLVQRAAICRRAGMHFSTCHAPNPELLVQWAAALGKEYVWMTPTAGNRQTPLEMYFRRCQLFSRACRRWNLTASLHNHLGARIESQQEVEDFLEACPDAGLILDTGHLSVAGGDPVEVIRRYHRRLSVLHVKDVFLTGEKDASGREGFRFCELGAGNNGFSHGPVLEELVRVGWSGWVYVEHDRHLREPMLDLKVSLGLIRSVLGR